MFANPGVGDVGSVGWKKNNEQIGALWEGVGILRLWKRCGRDPSWLLGWAAGLLLGC